MLKRRLYKACFIMSSFVSMAVASPGRSISLESANGPGLINKTGNHQFDSSGLCTCIPLVVNDEEMKSLRIQLNKNAAPFVKEYIKKNGFFLGKTKPRTSRYFSMIDSVFCQYDLPVELKYLAFIESGLKYNAISWAGAVGPWALMPVAAKEYGLKISRHNDERLDYNKSTGAAASLLRDLFVKYGDWLMVIAAYNCGPGGVDKAIKRSGSHHYWALQNYLPDETRKHVKKFIAVHYYFEGHGSLVTMTRAETEEHVKRVKAFVSSQRDMQQTDSLSTVVIK